jgi:hypothetical protein
VPLLQITVEPGGTTIVPCDDGFEPPPLALLQAATPIMSEAAKLRRRMIMKAPQVPEATLPRWVSSRCDQQSSAGMVIGAGNVANAGLNIMSIRSYRYFRKGVAERGDQTACPGNAGLCVFPFAKAFVTGFARTIDPRRHMRPRPDFDDPERE